MGTTALNLQWVVSQLAIMNRVLVVACLAIVALVKGEADAQLACPPGACTEFTGYGYAGYPYARYPYAGYPYAGYGYAGSSYSAAHAAYPYTYSQAPAVGAFPYSVTKPVTVMSVTKVEADPAVATVAAYHAAPAAEDPRSA